MKLASTGQTSNEHDLAQKVLEAFRSKDFDNYIQILATPKDLEEFMSDTLKHNGMERQNEWKEALGKFEKQADSKYRGEFKRILQKGEALGVDWTKIIFSDFLFQADKAANSANISLTGHINFTCSGTNYVLFGLEAIETSNGYKVNMLRTVQKGDIAEYVDPDLMDDEDI